MPGWFKSNTKLPTEGNQMDFTRKWDMADCVLKCKDSEELHVNRTLLALHSPYFKAMFFSLFTEANKGTIEIEINFWAMHEILNILHHVDRKFGLKGDKLYSAEELIKLHNASDEFDFPLIRDLCYQQFNQIEPKDAFEATITLGLHEQKSEILKTMQFKDIEAYLAKGITSLVLSPADAAVMVEKCKKEKR